MNCKFVLLGISILWCSSRGSPEISPHKEKISKKSGSHCANPSIWRPNEASVTDY